jgi:hypothetical protein
MFASRTARVNVIGFSNPIMTTKNGSPSDRSTILIGTPSLCVTIEANRNAKVEEISTVAPSQKFDPRRRIWRKREMNDICIERYPRVIIATSRASAFWL